MPVETAAGTAAAIAGRMWRSRLTTPKLHASVPSTGAASGSNRAGTEPLAQGHQCSARPAPGSEHRIQGEIFFPTANNFLTAKLRRLGSTYPFGQLSIA